MPAYCSTHERHTIMDGKCLDCLHEEILAKAAVRVELQRNADWAELKIRLAGWAMFIVGCLVGGHTPTALLASLVVVRLEITEIARLRPKRVPADLSPNEAYDGTPEYLADAPSASGEAKSGRNEAL